MMLAELVPERAILMHGCALEFLPLDALTGTRSAASHRSSRNATAQIARTTLRAQNDAGWISFGPIRSKLRGLSANELSGSRLIEAAPTPVEDTGVADQILDHRLGVRPINLGGRHEAPELLHRRWQPTVAGCRRRGTDQDQREHAIGKIRREQLCEGLSS